MSSSTTVTFTNHLGHELSGRLERPSGPPIGSALFAHCFTCSKDLRVVRRLTRALTEQGFAVLSFDFTGLGRSGGDFADATFSTDVSDLMAAATYRSDEVAPPSLLVGHSLGGTAVLSAAPDLPSVRAVATIAAPSSPAHVSNILGRNLEAIRRDGSAPVQVAGRTFTIGRSFIEDLDQHDPLERIARFRGATLILHSPIDEQVGIDNAEEIFLAARHPKSFVSLDTANHLLSEAVDSDYAATVIAAWAQRYIDGPADPSEPGSAEFGGYGNAIATATNAGGLTTRLGSRGFEFLADEPSDSGGDEKGPTPYDFLNLALASCTAMTLRMYADRKEWPLDEVAVSVTHDRVHAKDCAECEHAEGHVDVLDIAVRLTGDLDDSQRAAIFAIADRCPVHRTLTGQLELRTELEG